MPQPEPSRDVSWRGCDEGRVRTGMTLMELLIVVVIIGITMVFAIPSYQRMRERRYYGEAQNILHAVYSGERTYVFQKGVYLDNPTTVAQWQQIRMEDPNELVRFPVTFSVDVTTCGAPPPCFVAKAKRDSGPCTGFTITIDEDRIMAPNPAATPCWCPAC